MAEADHLPEMPRGALLGYRKISELWSLRSSPKGPELSTYGFITTRIPF